MKRTVQGKTVGMRWCIWKSYIGEFVLRFWNTRLFVLVIVWLVGMDMVLRSFRAIAQMLSLKGNAVVLPFIQNNVYFEKMLLLALICFYSNVPFMDRHSIYQVQRIGRVRWGRLNIAYLLISSTVLSTALPIISVFLSARYVSFSKEWGRLYRLIADGATGGLNPGISVSSSVMNQYTPLRLLFIFWLLDMLAFSVLGMFMYVVSLLMSRGMACFLATAMVFLSLMDDYFGYYLFSPLSWLKYSTWRNLFEWNKPDIVYIVTAYLLLLLVFAWVSQWYLLKTDWKNCEEA